MGKLVLSRKRGQAIVINGTITVTIGENYNGIVKLLIEAPQDVVVDRRELHEAKQALLTNASPK